LDDDGLDALSLAEDDDVPAVVVPPSAGATTSDEEPPPCAAVPDEARVDDRLGEVPSVRRVADAEGA
jgi:hypothetical protein